MDLRKSAFTDIAVTGVYQFRPLVFYRPIILSDLLRRGEYRGLPGASDPCRRAQLSLIGYDLLLFLSPARHPASSYLITVRPGELAGHVQKGFTLVFRQLGQIFIIPDKRFQDIDTLLDFLFGMTRLVDIVLVVHYHILSDIGILYQLLGIFDY
jgi:hypothetical protein